MPTGVYPRKKEDIEKLARNSGNPKGSKMSEDRKVKIRKARLKTGSPWNIGNNWNVGRRISIETRKKISESLKGEKSHLWKGGIHPINLKIRASLEYKIWRESVFKRDDWTCVFCKRKGIRIHADHIKPFAYFPKLRFSIENGRTLCVECHKKTDTYGGKIINKKYD